jgi:hypothetical protein
MACTILMCVEEREIFDTCLEEREISDTLSECCCYHHTHMAQYECSTLEAANVTSAIGCSDNEHSNYTCVGFMQQKLCYMPLRYIMQAGRFFLLA